MQVQLRANVRRYVPAIFALFAVATQMAVAGITGSGVTGLDNAGTSVIKIVTIFAGILCVVAIGTLIQNWMSRRSVYETLAELVGIAAFGWIATNPTVITGAIGLTGAQI